LHGTKNQILKSLLSDLFPNLDYSFTESDHVPQTDPEMMRLHIWHVTILSYKSWLQISKETFYWILKSENAKTSPPYGVTFQESNLLP